MRVFLFGNRGSASMLLQRLIQSEHEVVGVCSRETRLPMGVAVKNFVARQVVKLGLYPKPLFSYRGPFDDLASPDSIARRARISFRGSETIRSESFAKWITNLQPELALVSGFHRFIPAEVFTVPLLGTINFHPSLLPRHRGGTPNRWVVRAGEDETGVTAHFVTDILDAGDVVGARRVLVQEQETWGELERRVADETVSLAMDILENVKRGSLTRTRQDEAIATYEPSMRQGTQWIEWSATSYDVARTCNAMRPVSGGLARFGGQTMCLWEVVPTNEQQNDPPGTIVDIDNRGAIQIACGRGTVTVLNFLERGRIVSARRMIRRRAFEKGRGFELFIPVSEYSS